MKFKKLYLVLLIAFSVQSLLAQQDGYWDKNRATSKEIMVSAHDRIIIKTDDFPAGTTEVIYRITLLDQNQQMANSLFSVLKAIPDPTGISQGSAGAVFILSKISGDDKCNYAIFSKEELASKYKKNGITTDACLIQNTPISKDANRISIDKSKCLQTNSTDLWFGFESKNWIMSQKIILEVVPWVDKKLSRGWTLENRKSIIDQCKTSSLAQKMTNSDNFCVCILDKIQAKYKFSEFQKLLTIERSKAFVDSGNSCFNEKNTYNLVFGDLRNEAAALVKKGKYGEAIAKLAIIINEGKAIALDYNSIGVCYLFTKQFDKAIKFLKEGEKMDDAELLIKLNLAHAYLLNNDYQSAKVIYKKFQNQNVNDSLGWAEKIKLDFDTFEKVGIKNEDFNRVLKILKKKM